MDNMYGILDLLVSRGLDPEARTKLVRHQDKRFDLDSFIRDGWMDVYHAHQAKPVFRNCDFVVSFVGDGGTRAKFLGVYRVKKERRAEKSDTPRDAPFIEFRERDGLFYEMEKLPQFSDLEGRVVIEWGGGALAWHQYAKNKPIIEIYPPGRSLHPFSDYLDFSLSFAELQDLVSNPAAHRDWYRSLSAISGVYLILAEGTGQQYVGSAYGLDGIWGRWSQYAKNGHGNNKLLKQMVRKAGYPEGFRYSILQVLPKSATDAEVIGWESQYKRKLGSRATGLNVN